MAHLDFLAEKKNVIFSGPPGTGKTPVDRSRRAGRPPGLPGLLCLRPGIGGRLGQARRSGRLKDELRRLRRVRLLIVDLCLPGNYADVVVAG